MRLHTTCRSGPSDAPCDPLGKSRLGPLISPLVQEFGAAKVHVYACADVGDTQLLPERGVLVGGRLSPKRIFEHRVTGQAERLRRCHADMKRHAVLSGDWARYGWFVKVRPESWFHRDAPTPAALTPDAVWARAFSFGGGFNGDGGGLPSTMVTSNRKDPPWHDCQRRCMFRRRDAPRMDHALLLAAGSGGGSARAEAQAYYAGAISWDLLPERCFVIDDQVLYVPARFAAAYFGGATTGGDASGTPQGDHFAIVAGMAAGQWSEGNLTCQLGEAGVPLAMLDTHSTLCKRRKCVVPAPTMLCDRPGRAGERAGQAAGSGPDAARGMRFTVRL